MKRKFVSILFAVVLLTGLSLMPAVPAAAAVINVPGDYTTIQEAINAADPGDTITVDAGTYTESLTIDESVTLQGESSTNTTITGAHTVSASSVSLTDFALTLSGSGIVVKIDSSSAALSNISVTDCVLTMGTSPSIGVSIGYGIGASPNPVSNVTMDGNTFNGPADNIANPWKLGGEFTSPVGCQVTNVDFTENTVNDCSIPINLHDQDITDILIDGNTFSSTDGAVYVWEDEESPTGVLSQFVFTNNDLSAENTYGVGIDTHGMFTDANFGTGNAIHYNDFGGCDTTYGFGAVGILADLTSYVLDAEDNWWGDAAGPLHDGNTFNIDDQGSEVTDAVDYLAVDYVPWYDTDMEGDSFAPVTSEDGDFSSIQAAIDAATGTTITCKAGIYYESGIDIDKSLTVQSEAGAEATEICVEAEYGIGLYLGYDEENEDAPLAETVVIDGFYMYSAIALIWLDEVDNGSSVTISNNILENYDWAGIMSAAPTVDNVSSVTIEGNEISYGDCGIYFEAVAGGSELTIYHNVVFFNECGIDVNYLAEESTVTIEENIVSENGEGIYFEEVDKSTVTIIGNAVGAWEDETWEFSGNDWDGIYFDWVHSDSTVTIGGDTREEGNLISDNGWDENGYAGITVWLLEASSVVILNNGILDNSAYGVHISNFDEDSTVDIHLNSIAGNDEYGVFYFIPYTVNATCNFWGGPAGPQHASNPYNTAAITQGNDVVSSSVDYIPWMIMRGLVKDWNIWSRPIAPGEDSWAQMQAELVEDGIKAIYYYDSANEQWGIDPDEAGPLDAFYIKMPAESRIRYCISDEATWPGQKDMTVGWNFVGLAQLYPLELTVALSDAYWGTGQTELVGYNRVMSPSLNGEFWQYQRVVQPPSQLMYPTEGYWVLMVNDGVLGGFTETPIVP